MDTRDIPNNARLRAEEQARENWIFVSLKLGYYHQVARFNGANERADLTEKERAFLRKAQEQAHTVIPALRHAWTRSMLEWNAHDYSTEEELQSIVEDLKLIRDSFLSRYRTGWSTNRIVNHSRCCLNVGMNSFWHPAG